MAGFALAVPAQPAGSRPHRHPDRLGQSASCPLRPLLEILWIARHRLPVGAFMLNDNPGAQFARKVLDSGHGLVRLRAIGVVGRNVPRRTAAARIPKIAGEDDGTILRQMDRSEEQTYELQSLMRISYAVFCLKK